MKNIQKFRIPIICIFHCILLSSCDTKNKIDEESKKINTLVTTVHPSYQNITEYFQLNGITLIQKKDNIRSTVTGYITNMHFKLGDNIKAGQQFCTIGTKEQLALKYISKNDSSLSKFQEPLSVYSNASGTLSLINSLQGDYVSEGDILASVSELSSLIVQVNVPYEYNQIISKNKSCDIILPDGKTIHTSISGSLPIIDATTQSQAYFIRLPNQSLPENLNVTIRIPNKQKNNILCVPTEAVQTDEMQKEYWVMKIINDTLAVKVKVKTGLENDSLIEIISDKIKISDNIIFQGAFALADSSLVTKEK